jgi:hypothetical protein
VDAVATVRWLAPKTFESSPVLATIGEQHDPVIDDLRRRGDKHTVSLIARDVDPERIADLVTDVRMSAP